MKRNGSKVLYSFVIAVLALPIAIGNTGCGGVGTHSGCQQTNSCVTQKVTPTLTPPTASSIVYGATLSTSTLTGGSATANGVTVSGSFTWTNPATVPAAGSQSEGVTFTPTDTADYNTATTTTTVTVAKATPAITWGSLAAITYGTALSGTQLDATCQGGTISYNVSVGEVLSAGSQTITATCTPSDTNDYGTATMSQVLTVNEATPVITFTNSTVAYPATLTSSQLNASATGVGNGSLAGSFVYTAKSTTTGNSQTVNVGTKLSADTYTLTAAFTPSDTNNYTTATATATLSVTCGAAEFDSVTPPTIWSDAFIGVVPVTTAGGCFAPGDTINFSMGGSTTLAQGTSPNQVTWNTTVDDKSDIPYAQGFTDVKPSGQTSNTIYSNSVGDQNLGATYPNGDWISLTMTLSGDDYLVRYTAQGDVIASVPCGGTNISVDPSNDTIVINGVTSTFTADQSGSCASTGWPTGNSPITSSPALNGYVYATEPQANTITRYPESTPNATGTTTPTSGPNALSMVCNQPQSSVAATIAGSDKDFVVCRDKVGTGTTATLVEVDGATMTVEASTPLTGFTPISAFETSAVQGSILGIDILPDQQIIAVVSGHDNRINFYSTSNLTPVGVATVTSLCPQSPYRVAADPTNARFDVACANSFAPVTTVRAVDPMTGTVSTLRANVSDQVLGTFLVSQDGTTVHGAELGTIYLLPNN